MPTFLPGIRLLPSFFNGPHRNVETYRRAGPSRTISRPTSGGAHRDVLGEPCAKGDRAGRTSASSATPRGAPCGGPSFCATHVFQTWVERGQEVDEPVVRVRVGGTVEQSLSAYREDNGIDKYPSLAEKVGPKLDKLVRAPLIKGDLWKGLPEFNQWAATWSSCRHRRSSIR